MSDLTPEPSEVVASEGLSPEGIREAAREAMPFPLNPDEVVVWPIVVEAALAHADLLDNSEKVWWCAFGHIIASVDENGDCEGCSGRQSVRGCRWKLLADLPGEE